MKDDNGANKNSKTSGGSPGLLGRVFPNVLRGKDNSDDSLFKRTLSKLFGADSSSSTGHDSSQHKTNSKGPIIEEVDSDVEEVFEDEKRRDDSDGPRSNRNPIVEFPEDQDKDDEKREGNTRDLKYSTNHNKDENQSQDVSFKRVTYGGINGAYYTATTSRVATNGVTLEETKQANRSTGQATHKISKGIDDKGHSVLRRLDSDGKVNTTQILHNLNEDDLTGFEKLWKIDADRHLQGWKDKLDKSGKGGATHGQLVSWGGFQDPFGERSKQRSMAPQSGKTKKVVTINIE